MTHRLHSIIKSAGDRVVTLGVTGDAEIDDSLVAALQGPAFETLRAPAPRTVTAFTARGVVSAAALRAKAATLVAARITRPGGLTVAIGSTDETDPSAAVATDDPTGTGEQDSGLPYGA